MELADAELIAEFAVESQEGLANIEQQMLAIEAAGANIDVDLVNAVFRTMHSIKGTAGFFGLNQIGALAHCLEEVLNRMRNREIVPCSELVTTILQAADYMEGLIAAVETSNDADISIHVAQLQRFRPEAESQTAAPPAVATPGVQSETVREFIIECYDNLDVMDRDLIALEQSPTSVELLRGIFRTMHTIKGGAGFLGLPALEKLAHAAENLLGKLRDGDLKFDETLASALLASVDACRAGLQILEATNSDAGFDPKPVIQRLLAANPVVATPDQLDQPTPRTAGEMATSNQQMAAPPNTNAGVAAPENATGNKLATSAGDSTIRVDVALLDKLMTRVGELVLARNQVLQYTSGLENSDFIGTAQRLNLIITELQEEVMKTRMQPIGNVWSKFSRVVRDLSSQLGKQVRIEMEGKETELDKTIIEAIKDPLTHLVRNSVDHGIESPAARRAVGKPEEGCLLMRAYHEGGQVNIEIIDDGAGLNTERIRKKAVEKGLLSADQAARMSDRDISQVILLPGFSTAEQVTSVSGRGVGMDVVKTNIERIGGTIDVQSKPGQGTTIKIKIPLTLAIIPALIVTTDGDRYAIPQVNLLELVRLKGDQVKRGIEFVHGAPVYRLRGKLLPLVDLADRLGLVPEGEDANQAFLNKSVNIVVLRANDRQFGLVVGKVNDTEEIVVKPLGRQLKGVVEYAGATIMGDGAVALILDVVGLAAKTGLTAELCKAARDEHGGDLAKNQQAKQTLLLVDLGNSRRFAMPTSQVARLEKIPPSAIECADGREVIQYRDNILPLVRLHELFGIEQPDASRAKSVQLVVYTDQDFSCGFVVNRIVDIVETDLQLHSKKSADNKLLGTAVIQDRVTDVLNLQTLARHKYQ